MVELADLAGGVGEIVGRQGRGSVRAAQPLGLAAAAENEGSAAAGAAAGFDVIEDVADHPRAGEVEVEVAGGGQQQAGQRLAAATGDRVF